MRVTNLDTLSALIDRLVTENIKKYFFEKEGKLGNVKHQEEIIIEIKEKLKQLFVEVWVEGHYSYLYEERTFANNIVESIEELTINDINIGESDRARLELAMREEKRLRKSNEGRAKNKNDIDENFKKLTDQG